MVFLKEFFEKVDFEKNQQTSKKRAKLPIRQRVMTDMFLFTGDETVVKSDEIRVLGRFEFLR